MSHPDNLIKAYQKGFNLIGLANNHTRDCPCADNWENGALVSANHMKRLTEELKANWLWHGVGTEKTANIKTFDIKGGKIKVAFANIYMGGGDCSYICCQSDELIVLNSLRDADANLRILSIHSWNAETHKQLIETGVQFIKYYKGDIVFGNGPHSVEPVKIIESPITGKTGVMFESLGNFIHPSLKANSNHIIGRVLFDLDIIKLRQIQVIPIAVNRVTVSFNAIDPLTVPANFTWNKVGDSDWQSGFNTTIQGAYYNLVSANGH
jgi:poly-gamma-glutamate synthesis protein (capsule biosynthesis protein)